jgi:hypothetical protein
LKSRRGLASKAQKQLRLEMLPAGAVWWMARSARAAMTALHLSGVVFRRKWKPPPLKSWEGPFADPTQRLPQHPVVAAQKREEKRRYRLPEAMRQREAALAAERSKRRAHHINNRGRVRSVLADALFDRWPPAATVWYPPRTPCLRISSSCLRIWLTRSNVAEGDLTDMVVLTRAMAIELFDIVKHKVEDARHTQGS